MLDQEEEDESTNRGEALRTADFGRSIKILPHTFLIKSSLDNLRHANAYVINSTNSNDLVLIDVVRREHREELLRFRESGYTIKAIILTSGNMIGKAYTELSDIARELDTQIYIHPMDSAMTHTVDITGYHNFLQDLDLTVFHMPGSTSGSIVIYSGTSGALFTGNSAVGSPYHSNDNLFNRPIIKNGSHDLALQESWKSISVDFRHILPSYGKPQFDLDSNDRDKILKELTKLEKTKNQ